MCDQEWRSRGESDGGEGSYLGAEMRRLFDPEQEDLPPLFFETVLLARGIEEEVARYERLLAERALRQFFSGIGADYDAWRRREQQRRRRRWAGVTALTLVVVVLGIVMLTQSQVLEAMRRPLLQWFTSHPTPLTERNVTRYGSVGEMQASFPAPLPQEPPAGFRVVSVVLEEGFPTGPRAAIYYQRGDTADRTDRGDNLQFLVWSLADEPFSFPQGAAPEPLQVAGRPAYWVQGTGGGNDAPVWRNEGGWLLWDDGVWKYALTSSTIPRQEIVGVAEELLAW